MKRGLAVFLCLLLPFLFLSGTFAAAGEEKPWSTLYYVVDPAAEGEEGERGELINVGSTRTDAENPMQFRRGITVSCTADQTKLFVNGEQVEEYTRALFWAGMYEVKIQNTVNNAAVTYYIEILPDLGFENNHIFTEFPVITCPNAERLEIKRENTVTLLDPALPLTEFGAYEVRAYGLNSERPYACMVHIHYCKTETVYDPGVGKWGIKLTVGEFPDVDLVVRVDGGLVVQPETLITGVGNHRLSVRVNGEPADGKLYPNDTDMRLQVRLRLDKLEDNEPFWFDLSEWNANFYLDGKPVSAEFGLRVTGHGSHELTVCDQDGNPMQNMILLSVGSVEDYHTVDSVTFTFRNPHRIYAAIAAAAAVMLLGTAVFFFAARRKIV